MSHLASRPHISRPLAARLNLLPLQVTTWGEGIAGFGVFIDTHRDQPHVGTFTDDIHRGDCRPMLIDYDPLEDDLVDPATGQRMHRHQKHLFITPEFWQQFLLNSLMETGADPRRGDGTLPTSHFRDARKGLYQLRSFRQMVDWNYLKK